MWWLTSEASSIWKELWTTNKNSQAFSSIFEFGGSLMLPLSYMQQPFFYSCQEGLASRLFFSHLLPMWFLQGLSRWQLVVDVLLPQWELLLVGWGLNDRFQQTSQVFFSAAIVISVSWTACTDIDWKCKSLYCPITGPLALPPCYYLQTKPLLYRLPFQSVAILIPFLTEVWL